MMSKTLLLLIGVTVCFPQSLSGSRQSGTSISSSSGKSRAYGLIRKQPSESNNLSAGNRTSCVFEGKLYSHGSNISRSDPCERCFCFRAEVLCWNIKCPEHKTRDNCKAVPLKWACCPIYECEAPSKVSIAAVPSRRPLRPLSIPRGTKGSTNVKKPDCEVDGVMYKPGQIIPSASGACLECRCGNVAQIQCFPKTCRYSIPLLVPGASALQKPVRITPNPLRRSLF